MARTASIPGDQTIQDGPLVSVVIATYNMGRFLPLAVRSALGQTYRNVEVLVIDDGSTDGTGKLAAELCEDTRVRYFRHENAGQAVTKNRGVREARGDYVAFLDADDFWAAGKLALQMPLLLHSPRVGVVYARYREIDEAGNECRVVDSVLHRGEVTGPLFVRNFVSFGTSVVRRECFDRLGGFDESLRMGIDYDLWLRFSTRYLFDYVDQPLLYYRVWPGQMSRDTLTRYFTGIRIMQRFVRDHPGAVCERMQKEGWAHTYVGLGYCVWAAEGRRWPGQLMFARALRHKVTYVPAWRAMIASVLHLTR